MGGKLYKKILPYLENLLFEKKKKTQVIYLDSLVNINVIGRLGS